MGMETTMGAVMLLALAAGPVQALEQTRLEPLQAREGGASADAQSEGAPSPTLCTGDGRWCVRTSRGEDGVASIEVAQQVPGEREPRTRHQFVTQAEGDQEEAPWPFIIRMPAGTGLGQPHTDPVQAATEDALVGVVVRAATTYSGGSASASRLHLIRVVEQVDDVQVDEVLSVPLAGASMITACFSEADVRRRADACHDEYGFEGRLTLVDGRTGMPTLRYVTEATRFPVGASRDGDASTRPALTAADLHSERDPACSYERTWRWSGGRYQADQPLPECSGYTGL